MKKREDPKTLEGFYRAQPHWNFIKKKQKRLIKLQERLKIYHKLALDIINHRHLNDKSDIRHIDYFLVSVQRYLKARCFHMCEIPQVKYIYNKRKILECLETAIKEAERKIEIEKEYLRHPLQYTGKKIHN